MEKVAQNNIKLNIAIQINGKTRGVVKIDNDLDEDDIYKMLRSDKKISKYIENKKILKKIYVKGKIFNFVI